MGRKAAGCIKNLPTNLTGTHGRGGILLYLTVMVVRAIISVKVFSAGAGHES